MRKIAWLLILVVLVLGMVGLLVLQSDEASSEVDAATARSDALASAVAEAPVVPTPEPVNSLSPRRMVQAAPERADPEPPSAASPDRADPSPHADGIAVEGRVVVVDANGVEHASAHGSFEPTFWHGSSGSGRGNIPVVDGRFNLRCPEDHVLGIDDIVLDGRVAWCEVKRWSVADRAPIVVRAHWSRPVRLHVIDADSRAELSGVIAVATDGWRTDDNIHPGSYQPEDVLAGDAISPIELEVRSRSSFVRWEQKLCVSAPDHAWNSIQVDFRTGADVTIELVRGGELVVEIVGDPAPLASPRAGRRDADHSAAVLRLRTPSPMVEIPDADTLIAEAMTRISGLSADEMREAFPDGQVPSEEELRTELETFQKTVGSTALRGQMFAELEPDRSGTTKLAGLPEGKVLVALERGDHWDRPQVLAESTAEVVAGSTTHVTLTLQPLLALRRVRLAGTVHFSPQWESTHLDLKFEPAAVPDGSSVDEFELEFSDLKPIPGQPGLYRFNAGEVLPGRWLVVSYAYEFQQVVDTGLDGTDHAEITIGDPAEVVVHLIDDDSGQPLPPTVQLHWNCERPPESTGGSLDSAEWDGARGGWMFRAPAGHIEVSIMHPVADQFVDAEETFDAKPGTNEFTLRVRRANAVLLRFTLEGTDPDKFGDGLWDTALQSVEDDTCKVSASSCHGDDTYVFHVPAPGRYVVKIPSLPGCEPVAPFEITARRGETVEQEVKLVRSR